MVAGCKWMVGGLSLDARILHINSNQAMPKNGMQIYNARPNDTTRMYAFVRTFVCVLTFCHHP